MKINKQIKEAADGEMTPDEVREAEMQDVLLGVFRGWGYYSSILDKAMRHLHHQKNIPSTISRNKVHNIELYLKWLYKEAQDNMNRYEELYQEMFPEE